MKNPRREIFDQPVSTDWVECQHAKLSFAPAYTIFERSAATNFW
jgi:hypothetical protein